MIVQAKYKFEIKKKVKYQEMVMFRGKERENERGFQI